ncbi:MAG: BadF/BadG/BcrA/BcrD ATPase family protein [Roseibium sp.]
MLSAMKDTVLAVDGGGTRCRLALESSRASFRIEVGSANITTDFEGTVTQLINGLETLSRKVGWPMEAIENVPAFIGLAGFQAANDLDRLSKALSLSRARFDDDRPAAVRGALGTKDGALIHSGTGSFFAVQRDNTTRFSGGWGSILGDQGSAAWFGRQALSLVLDAEDQLREKTSLTGVLIERFEGPAGILAFANKATPSDFGELAPLVIKLADDPMSQVLIQQAAEHFERNLRLLGWSVDNPVCLTGGLAPHLAPYLTNAVQNMLTPPAGSPLDGSVALARSFANEELETC